MTPLQQKIFNYLSLFIQDNEYAPSLREIAQGIGISPKSISLISRGLHALAAKGIISLQEGEYRNIKILEKENPYCLPLVGRIAAGVPIEAIEDLKTVDLQPLLASDDRFVLQVKGSSMIDEGILDGDLVICKPTERAKEGDIVVALIDSQEATLKRISYKISDRITLIPANPTMKPKAYLPMRVRIQGVLVGLLRMTIKP